MPLKSITPALIQALRVVVEEANNDELYTIKNPVKMIHAETTLSLGRIPTIELENARCNITLDDHIVLQPLPVLRVPDQG